MFPMVPLPRSRWVPHNVQPPYLNAQNSRWEPGMFPTIERESALELQPTTRVGKQNEHAVAQVSTRHTFSFIHTGHLLRPVTQTSPWPEPVGSAFAASRLKPCLITEVKLPFRFSNGCCVFFLPSLLATFLTSIFNSYHRLWRLWAQHCPGPRPSRCLLPELDNRRRQVRPFSAWDVSFARRRQHRHQPNY